MKRLILILLFATPMAQAAVIESCRFEVMGPNPIAVGEVLVKTSEDGTRRGTYKLDEILRIESSQIEIREYTKEQLVELNQNTGANSLAQILEVDLTKLDSAKSVMIDPEGQHDDESGATIISFYDDAHGLIKKIVQAGWSVGECKE